MVFNCVTIFCSRMQDIEEEAFEVKAHEGHVDTTNHFNDLWCWVVDQQGHDFNTSDFHHDL